jgi:hypothetical protein
MAKGCPVETEHPENFFSDHETIIWLHRRLSPIHPKRLRQWSS